MDSFIIFHRFHPNTIQYHLWGKGSQKQWWWQKLSKFHQDAQQTSEKWPEIRTRPLLADTYEIKHEVSTALTFLVLKMLTVLHWLALNAYDKKLKSLTEKYFFFYSHLSEDLDIHQTFAEISAEPWRHGWCSGLGERMKGGRIQDS